MTSEKIKELLEMKEYLLTIKEYLSIVTTSPQINWMMFDKEADVFRLDTDDKYSFEFRVYNPENEEKEGKRYGS